MRPVPHKDAMNILNVSLQHSILTLVGHGRLQRLIAREPDIDRETIGKMFNEVVVPQTMRMPLSHPR